MDAKDTQETPAGTPEGVRQVLEEWKLDLERGALQREEQAYDQGYHEGFEQRDKLDKTAPPADYVEGYKTGYPAGFKDGVSFGVSLQVAVVPRQPEQQTASAQQITLPPGGSLV